MRDHTTYDEASGPANPRGYVDAHEWDDPTHDHMFRRAYEAAELARGAYA